MKKLFNLTKRNIKVYFSDKSMFFVSLITPLILLVLYSTFLGNVFKDSFVSAFPKELGVTSKIINALASGQILASLLAVSCITVAFTSNLLMVNDRTNGAIKDINVTPTSKATLSLSYFLASFISTIIVNFVGLALCFIYTKTQGWFYTFEDCMILICDVILLTLFGVSLSSVINFNLKTPGQASAVGTIVSAGYGFICGAYMPISSFGKGLQKTLSFLPSTYGTSLMKNHAISAAFREVEKLNVPKNIVSELKEALDMKIAFLGNNVSITYMYVVMVITIVILVVINILQNILAKNK